MVNYGRRRAYDRFAEFSTWLTEQGYSPNTSTQYSCLLRSAERSDRNFESNAELIKAIAPTRYEKYRNALHAWERWKTALKEQRKLSAEEFPVEVRLAIKVIEAYNLDSDKPITLSY